VGPVDLALGAEVPEPGLTRLFAEKLAALTVGDPMDPDTKVGPLATESGRDDVEKYVQDAVDKGATVVVGGRRPDGPGWFYPPTVLLAESAQPEDAKAGLLLGRRSNPRRGSFRPDQARLGEGCQSSERAREAVLAVHVSQPGEQDLAPMEPPQ